MQIKFAVTDIADSKADEDHETQPVISGVNAARPAETASRLPLFEPDSVLQLFPFLVRRDNQRDWSLVRIGCETLRVISTSRAGAQGARLLRRGYTLREAAAILSRSNCGKPVSLEALIKALYQGEFIRSVNGTTVSTLQTSSWREWRHRLGWAAIRARKTAVCYGLRLLPIPISYAALDILRPGTSSSAFKSIRETARRNIGLVFGGSLPSPELDRIARDFTTERVRSTFDMAMLSNLSDYRTARWLRRSTVFYGLENLEQALAAGNGVLLCGLHFSSAHLLLALLWLHGYSFTGAGGITLADRHRVLPFENAALKARLGGCGEVKWNTKFSVANALAICRTLSEGGIGLVYPDGFFARPKGEVANYFGHYAAHYEPARTRVPFLGTLLDANTGAPWIYKQSKAALIPLKLLRRSRHRFEVIVGRELRIDRSQSLEAVTSQIYAYLEKEIYLTPSAWDYWRTFQNLSSLQASGPE